MPHHHRISVAALRAVAAAALLASLAPLTLDAQSLRGSHASVRRMYHRARIHHLAFLRTETGVKSAVRRGRLVRLPGNADYQLHGVSFPYALPATRTFVERLASQYHDACGEQLVVTSAVRPSTEQPSNSVARSVHPTGMAVDLRKPEGKCLGWLRGTLRELEGAGLIEATEEHWPAHFHVAVFPKSYTRYVSARTRGTSRRVHTVRRGDTLWELAHDYGTSVAALISANDLAGEQIAPGQKLVIPATD